MSVLGAFLMPHPPVIMPEVGGGQEKQISSTDNACREAARRIAALEPETVILCTPHTTSYGDYIHISPGERAKGDFGAFRASGLMIETTYDHEFVRAWETAATSEGIPAGTRGEQDARLDHAAMIPLAYIQRELREFRTVRVGISGLPLKTHFRLGEIAAQVAERLDRRVVFLASGDLSHRLLKQGPYGFAPEGPRFDKEVERILASGNLDELLQIPAKLARDAGECGLRPLVMMAGFLSGHKIEGEILSYEGPFGVGYGVAAFVAENPGKENGESDCTECNGEDAFTRLARLGIEAAVRHQGIPDMPEWVPASLLEDQAGVFVSIKKHGALRGCIGTISAVTGSIAEEILRNAAASSMEDPRFPPVSPDELPALTVSVDVLGKAEKVEATYKLDPKRYGVIVTSGWRRGLLLPNLEGVDTVEKQLSIALAKAGIHDDEPFSIERFEVVRHQ